MGGLKQGEIELDVVGGLKRWNVYPEMPMLWTDRSTKRVPRRLVARGWNTNEGGERSELSGCEGSKKQDFEGKARGTRKSGRAKGLSNKAQRGQVLRMSPRNEQSGLNCEAVRGQSPVLSCKSLQLNVIFPT